MQALQKISIDGEALVVVTSRIFQDSQEIETRVPTVPLWKKPREESTNNLNKGEK